MGESTKLVAADHELASVTVNLFCPSLLLQDWETEGESGERERGI